MSPGGAHKEAVIVESPKFTAEGKGRREDIERRRGGRRARGGGMVGTGGLWKTGSLPLHSAELRINRCRKKVLDS